MKKTVQVIIVLLSLVYGCCPLWKISAKDSFFDDDAYIVYNSSGGYVDRQRYADMPIDPSIYTQWMTALLIIENTRHFDKQLNIGLNDLDTAFYYGFEIQEQVCVKDALFALLFCNSGEMANALARHMTGDREEFVRLMNQKASSLGMENTTFTNVTGDVAVKQKTTLRDLTVLMDEVINDPVFQDIVSEDRYVFSSNQKQYILENKNWVMMEQDSKVRCCILPIKEKTFSVFASTQIKGADFLTIGYGDSKQNCIEMATNLYEEMRSTYHELVPLEKNSVVAYGSMGIFLKKQYPIQMPEDLKLVVGEEVTYEDLSYQVLPKEYTFFLLPNQSLGKVNIYYKNQLLCTKDILSVSFFISNDCMVVAGIFFMLAIYELYYQHKKR